MGSVVRGHLAAAGADVTLVDVSPETVDALRRDGLRLEDKAGTARTIETRATADPSEVGPVDLLIVFVKCYHTEAAIGGAAAMISPNTAVLSLQNGWERPGSRRSSGRARARRRHLPQRHRAPPGCAPRREGPTVFRRAGAMTDRVAHQGGVQRRGLQIARRAVLKEIWSSSPSTCTLPTTALSAFSQGGAIGTGTLALMQGILHESSGGERSGDRSSSTSGGMISGLCHQLGRRESSMFQDNEAGRRTEIDVVNGAVADAGKRLGIATPLNDAMVWLVRSLEAAITAGRKG
jgi:2-dehydropantoate 2-reductase